MSDTTNKHQGDALDLRDLPAPEPMMRVLAAADAMQPGQLLEVLTPLMPHPLLPLLEARGLRWSAETCADGSARVVLECPESR